MKNIDEQIAKLKEVANKLYNLHHFDEADTITSVVLTLTESVQKKDENASQDKARLPDNANH